MIRKAEQNDVEQIISLAVSRYVDSYSNPSALTGLIDYKIPNKKTYSYRINKGLFYVAEDSEKIIGMIDGYNSSILNDLFYCNRVTEKMLTLEKESFIYLNTLAVAREYEGKGISTGLFNKLLSEISIEHKSIWTAILHKPVHNIVSSAFAFKRGFNLQTEVTFLEKYTLGLYKLEL
jgi:hypothetical protein